MIGKCLYIPTTAFNENVGLSRGLEVKRLLESPAVLGTRAPPGGLWLTLSLACNVRSVSGVCRNKKYENCKFFIFMREAS